MSGKGVRETIGDDKKNVMRRGRSIGMRLEKKTYSSQGTSVRKPAFISSTQVCTIYNKIVIISIND